jgi:glycerol uptake facilitator-like aquaporin
MTGQPLNVLFLCADLGCKLWVLLLAPGLFTTRFELPVLQLSIHSRTGFGQWVAEAGATFNLLVVIWGRRAHVASVTTFAVAAYVTGAYWFIVTTSFANPAVTIARSLSDTFAGVRPADAPGFILAQLLGLLIALPLFRRSDASPA